jgi:orotidine-5'-phosphate decarboxylase
MTYQQLVEQIKIKQSYLCVGLDTDTKKIPQHLLDADDPIFEFNKAIIDATHNLCVAYKPNLAFYEVNGSKGWESLQKTIDYIPKECLVIADAKRGDIGNTATMYAETFFNHLKADAVTIAPYMGSDSIKPFLNFKDKWAIVLGLTSNEGAFDFQTLELNSGEKLFENVIATTSQWGTFENMMYVVGATKAEMIADIRKIIPNHFLLIPGVGAQGGSLKEVSKFGLNKSCGLLVNSSRQIIYSSNKNDFAVAARNEAEKVQQEMKIYLKDMF